MSGRAILALLPVLPLLTAGCRGPQSALDPRGPAATELVEFSWLLFGAAGVIWLLTMGLLLAGLATPAWTRRVRPIWIVLGLGLVFPVVTLLALSIHTALLGGRLEPGGTALAGGPPLRVEVTGQQYWWEVVYRDPELGTIVSANELHLPVGRRVEVYLTSRDVIHSFWVPSLHGKLDLIPGRVNRLVLVADTPGLMRGQCAEFCGEQHALMAFFVVAHTAEAFADWLTAKARPARTPAEPELAAGAQAFLTAGCGTCHAVRGLAEPDAGLAAVGRLGPDLTHVGSRLSLAAGAMPNGVGPLAAWIAGSQRIKPGNRMPSFDTLDGATLTAIARYLESLE